MHILVFIVMLFSYLVFSLTYGYDKDDLIIWVHGTYLLSNARFKKFFDKKEQLKKSVDLESSHYFKSTIDGLSHFADQTQIYFFGWSGSLSSAERKKAGRCLYQALGELKVMYERTYKRSPKFHIITHSHGGNVVLYMAPEYEKKSLFHIESVTFLACPVQERTALYICSPLFKSVYSFYSRADWVQRLAPNAYHHHSSKKLSWCFLSHRKFPVCPTLKQAAIAYNHKNPGHNSFRKKKY